MDMDIDINLDVEVDSDMGTVWTTWNRHYTINKKSMSVEKVKFLNVKHKYSSLNWLWRTCDENLYLKKLTNFFHQDGILKIKNQRWLTDEQINGQRTFQGRKRSCAKLCFPAARLGNRRLHIATKKYGLEQPVYEHLNTSLKILWNACGPDGKSKTLATRLCGKWAVCGEWKWKYVLRQLA